uniref:DUF4283 domain-containing protein n=2 Tax=Setaria viridis TaxID=4556 RepID=A0A4U6W4P2_SETVI|nr:hypothetical protein SEVIR_1G021600v2 [Setaria viridis]
MLLRFASAAQRELVRNMSPIDYQGGRLELERPQETSNRFFRVPDWLAYVAVTDYPPEHWDEDHIRRSLSGFCNVMGINPTCLTGFDFSPLRLVIKVNHRLEIPSELWVDADDMILGGSIASIMPIRIWPRAEQVGVAELFSPSLGHHHHRTTLRPPRRLWACLGQSSPTTHNAPHHHNQIQPGAHAALLHLAALHALAKLSVTPPQLPSPRAPPSSLVGSSEEHGDLEDETFAYPLPSPAPRARNSVPKKRQSSRIAAKANGNFVHSTDKAMQLKALQNSLAPCSSKLKSVVEQRKILSKSKIQLSTADLRKLVAAAGVGHLPADGLAMVPSVPE